MKTEHEKKSSPCDIQRIALSTRLWLCGTIYDRNATLSKHVSERATSARSGRPYEENHQEQKGSLLKSICRFRRHSEEK